MKENSKDVVRDTYVKIQREGIIDPYHIGTDIMDRGTKLKILTVSRRINHHHCDPVTHTHTHTPTRTHTHTHTQKISF